MNRINAVFVATRNALEGSGGGVQVCTRDYQLLLQQAGFDLELVPFDMSRRLGARILNRLVGHSYRRQVPAGLAAEIASAVERTVSRFVFFNQADFPGVARALRQRFGTAIKLVQLSHGLDSTDLAIHQQTQRAEGARTGFDLNAALMLGGRLQWEADFRRQLDASLCISPLDAELERWLGCPQTRWFSRPVHLASLDHSPVDGRVGCVATLDHGPNVTGLKLLLAELAKGDTSKLRLRLVGGPASGGEEFARAWKFVEYAGRLDDAQLRKEASTWCCFINPIFDYARGCSTKCAVALGWGLPLVTTVSGARGYQWDEKIVPLPATPAKLASMVRDWSRLAAFPDAQQKTAQMRKLQPTLEELAGQMRDFLLAL